MPADSSPTSRSHDLTHCLDVTFSADERQVRPHTQAPQAIGARWVEAANTEFGLLSSAMLDEGSYAPGFATKGADRALATAETAFMLAIDDDEKQTDEDDRPAPPAGMIVAVPAARPRSPIAGQTSSTAQATPPRAVRALTPHKAEAPARPSLSPEAVRAVLSQPTAALLPAVDRTTSSPVEAGPALALPAPKPRAKSFAPPARARVRSFAGQLGVPVMPPAAAIPASPTAPMSSAHRLVVVTTTSPRTRSLNMAAAILSGLAAAMAVMAVVVSV